MRHDGAGSSAVGSPDGKRGGDREIREQKKRNHYRKEGAGYQGSRAPGPLSPWGAGQSDLPFPAYQHGFEYFHTFNASKHSLAVSGTRSYARCHRTVGNEK